MLTAKQSYTEIFRNEDDIYVQNVSNNQVSVTFEVSANHTESKLFPRTKDPCNLTQEIPFNAIKNSMDFRKMLQRTPETLKLLTRDEYLAYYAKQARTSGKLTRHGEPDVDAAIDAAARRSKAILNHEPLADAPEPIKLHEVVSDGKYLDDPKKRVQSLSSVQAQDEINPQVLQLCLQVQPQLDDSQKMPANSLLGELDGIPNLTVEDLDYVRSHGHYKSVSAWAKRKIEELLATQQVDDVEPELAPAPKKPAKKVTKPAKVKKAVATDAT